MTTVGTGNCFDETEAKTGAMLRLTLITRIEAFEDMGQILLRDSNPRITDGNGNLPIIRIDRNCDTSANRGVLQCIIEKIGNHSLKLSGFSVDNTAVG
jgi:hypothetical protein